MRSGLAAMGVRFRRRARRRTDLSTEHALRIAWRTMRAKRYCAMVTSSPSGPTARVLQPFRPDRDLTIHLGTDPQSRKAADIRRTGRCVLIYQDDRRATCVTLDCVAELLTDAKARRRWFMPHWVAFWPDGPGPDFAVVRCRPDLMEIWSGGHGIAPDPFGRRSLQVRLDAAGWQATTAAPARSEDGRDDGFDE